MEQPSGPKNKSPAVTIDAGATAKSLTATNDVEVTAPNRPAAPKDMRAEALKDVGDQTCVTHKEWSEDSHESR